MHLVTREKMERNEKMKQLIKLCLWSAVIAVLLGLLMAAV